MSFEKMMIDNYRVRDSIIESLKDSTTSCQKLFQEIQERTEANQLKVLQAFQTNNVSEFHLHGSNGYGYGDIGRDTLENIYASLFKTESALVRAQIVSGTHAIAIGLLGNLNRGEELICATGSPYDTLQKVIGLAGKEDGSLISTGVKYKEIPLVNGIINLEALLSSITKHTKLILFQRSKGYEWRPSININELERVISAVKEKYPHIICMIDNCYGELVETKEPTEIGADLLAGSLIKNPGGGLALGGGYLVGKNEYIRKAAVRLTAPGIGIDVGASYNFNYLAYQGLFIAPLIVGEALKGAVLAADFFQRLGYNVLPAPEEKRTDVIQAIQLNSEELMLAFCEGIQKACPLDCKVKPEPSYLPGYPDQVIMAGGTFVQGSSIELSADGPIRSPYNIYLQGGLSLAHIKTGILLAAEEMALRKGD